MSENSNSDTVGGDSDSSLTDSTKVCRDFMRNVCQRGRNCRFAHPDNLKVRTDPIFCHDYQTGRCFRSSCKFIHCTREEEDHFKQTGELPEGVSDPEDRAKKSNGTTTRGHKGRSSSRSNGNSDTDQVPLCKDFLKGLCDRPPGGCRYRHTVPRGPLPSSTSPTYGPPVMVRTSGGIRMMMAPVVSNRRKGRGDEGPEAKLARRFQMNEYYEEDYEVEEYEPPPPPPPPRNIIVPINQGFYTHQPHIGQQQYHITVPQRNGVLNHHQSPQEQFSYYQQSPQDAMKALEDENFMLKRRIEELKSSNEFLLSQNAQLRLNNTLSVGTSVAGPLAVSAVSVSAAPCASAPSIIGITSSSLSGTQPLPTISISTLPTVATVTPVSISQTQIQSQPQPQIYIPAQPN